MPESRASNVIQKLVLGIGLAAGASMARARGRVTGVSVARVGNRSEHGEGG